MPLTVLPLMAEGTDLTADAYKALLDHGVDIVTMIDEEGFVTYQSSAVTEILGYLPEELLGQHIFDFLHPDDVELASQSFSKLLQGNDIDGIVVRFKHKSGQWYKVEVVGRVYEHQGKTSMILNTRKSFRPLNLAPAGFFYVCSVVTGLWRIYSGTLPRVTTPTPLFLNRRRSGTSTAYIFRVGAVLIGLLLTVCAEEHQYHNHTNEGHQ